MMILSEDDENEMFVDVSTHIFTLYAYLVG